MSDGMECEGWATCHLPDIAEIVMGQSPPGNTYNNSAAGLPFFQGKTDFTERHPVVRKWCSAPNKVAHAGDVLISIRAPVGPTNLADQTCAIGRGLAAIRPKDGIPTEFLWYVLRLQEESLASQGTGSTFSAINRATLDGVTLSLPPLAEQRRIVAKVESLLSRVRTVQERLARVPLLVKRFRQAVLTAACNGQLTADWREAHPQSLASAGDRDGDVLTEFSDLPDCWGCKRAAQVVEPGTVVTYGIVLPGPNRSEGVPYIRGHDIDDNGTIHVDQLWRTSPEIAAKHARSELRAGDVLLCVIRHLRVAIVPSGLDGANLTQGTVRLRPSDEVNASFLASYLGGPFAQAWMKQRYIGMAMPRINVAHARDIPVPLPPIEEQHEIVRRVEALLKFADAIERRVTAATARADKLTQAILAKAFRGELVPTEADLARAEGRDYETADQLLARIRASTRTETVEGKPRKARRRRAAAK